MARSVTLNDDLKNVTSSDVSKAFNKYMSKVTWVYRGDPAKVNVKLFTQPVAPPAKAPEVILDKKIN